MAGPVLGQEPDPLGNNGTVKVDGVEFDSHPDNEAHVGCTFQTDFYNADEGDLNATVTFEGVPSTGGGQLLTDQVFIGEGAAGGGTDLDASVTYDLADALAGIPPHPQQGHHVELTVEAEGSIGNDVKHKVFWVEGCSQVGIPTTTTTGPVETTTTLPGGTPTTTTPPGGTTRAPGRPGQAPPATPIVGQPRFTG